MKAGFSVEFAIERLRVLISASKFMREGIGRYGGFVKELTEATEEHALKSKAAKGSVNSAEEYLKSSAEAVEEAKEELKKATELFEKAKKEFEQAAKESGKVEKKFEKPRRKLEMAKRIGEREFDRCEIQA